MPHVDPLFVQAHAEFNRVSLRWSRIVGRAFALAIAISASTVSPVPMLAQEQPPKPDGFQRVEGKFLDVVTDLPMDESLRELPEVFAAAMPVWCQLFGVPEAEADAWHTVAYIMLDRQRFKDAGFFPDNIPNFPFGFQYGDELWVTEQASAYYRRHLLLHEGTHWFMNRRYGQYGPPWLMEGMAEWLGTHRWKDGKLEMGIVPISNEEVPYWGRTKLIREQLSDGIAPSLESILRYDNRAHQQVEAYAWSWAAVIFLKEHPQSKEVFQKLFEQPMRSDSSMTRWLFTRLRAQWPALRTEWAAFISDLDYGFDTRPGLLQLSTTTQLVPHQPHRASFNANQSWQASGLRVEGPAKVRIAAEGRYSIGETTGPWICEPSGVTLEYYRGQPLGKVLLAIAAPQAKEPNFTQPLTVFPVGSGGDFELPESGELFFRVNEACGALSDNEGQFTITISR